MNKKKKTELIKEYILFNLTGTTIFVVCQLLYTTLLSLLNWGYFKAHIICTILSAVLNFFLNSVITFKSKDFSKVKFLKILVVQFSEFAINSIILVILVEIINVPEIVAPIICPMIMTPFMFLLSRNVLKPKKKSRGVDF